MVAHATRSFLPLAATLMLCVGAGCGSSDSDPAEGTGLNSGVSSASESGEASGGTAASSTTDVSTTGTDASTTEASTSGTDTTDSGETTGTGTGGDELPPYCHFDCSGTGTCMAAQICEGGLCEIGCNDENDCVTGNVCRDFGQGLQCAQSCNAPSDCVLAGGAWDEDNWTCDNGACNYLGCMSDGECATGQVCRQHPGLLEIFLGYNTPACVPACTTAADCDQGGEPTTADNFACESGGCRWIGCLNDGECPGSQVCN